MSIRIVSEVMDHAPPELSHGEVRLLLSLAEWANDETRECWPGDAAVMRRMGGVSWDAVAKLLRSLSRKGYEVRVPQGRDRSGRPVVAARGHRTVYRIPTFSERSAETSDLCAAR